ncbi:uncharacterized protein LOC111294092 isoform X4 [Durio zibethinus]|uniref:Uncharacterized protein LOC111294092 isoform X4 n=1 Tax=Durio zibethinus TaxID=66656 RepID=A0A6P5YRS0_DURZI|nr:uncharacterized protein LOC111294092 isoform X4 [Durio zibethinus]
MRNLILKRFIQTTASSLESPQFSYGLNWGLAGKGVIVKDKAFQNLKSSELQKKGATVTESLSGLPVHVRGTLRRASAISKAQYSRLLKQVTAHLSSISNIFVHDGAIGSSPKSDAKVRVISDSPSAVLRLSNVLWETSTRAVSHDSCPLTIYAATSISAAVEDVIGLGAQGNNGFIAADVERSSLILCGKAFSDINGTKEALATLSEPVISARGGLPLSARLLVSGDSVVLIFAPENVIRSFADLLVSADAGVVLSHEGVLPLFKTKMSSGENLYKMPSAVILATSDRHMQTSSCKILKVVILLSSYKLTGAPQSANRKIFVVAQNLKGEKNPAYFLKRKSEGMEIIYLYGLKRLSVCNFLYGSLLIVCPNLGEINKSIVPFGSYIIYKS